MRKGRSIEVSEVTLRRAQQRRWSWPTVPMVTRLHQSDISCRSRREQLLSRCLLLMNFTAVSKVLCWAWLALLVPIKNAQLTSHAILSSRMTVRKCPWYSLSWDGPCAVTYPCAWHAVKYLGVSTGWLSYPPLSSPPQAGWRTHHMPWSPGESESEMFRLKVERQLPKSIMSNYWESLLRRTAAGPRDIVSV